MTATITAAPPAPGDSAGITGTPAVVRLDQLAAHPRNPRRDLGDLAEMTASMAAHGVFEPLVVLTAAAYTAAAEADGDPERPAAGITHVIVMGHRRAAAARAAGLAGVPVVVRDDLAGAAAIAAMIAENFHREGLDPLAEAEAMAELARRGWRQRRIAAETGCSQAHVSKRMALLQLPEGARAVLAAGKLPVADALELHKITGAGDREVTDAVIDRAVGEITAGRLSAASAVSLARQEARRALAEKQARAELAAAGIPVVTGTQRDRQGWPRVWDGDEGPHRQAGCLAAMIGWSGTPEYVCTDPAGHPRDEQDPHAVKQVQEQARENEDDRESRSAAKARDSACITIAAGPLPAPAELARILADTLLEGASHAEAMRLACRWLREAGTAPPSADHYRWRDQLAAAGDHAALQRYAYAYALAAGELHARSKWHPWGGRHITHLARLAGQAGYQPSAWEQARLEEARAAGAVRATLACATCGCTGTGCEVRFDRDAGKPVRQCGWNCSRHTATRDSSDPDGESPDDPGGKPDDVALQDTLIGIIIAIEPTTAAGSRLPDTIADAISDARRQFAGAYRDWHPGQDASDVLAAARDLAAAAAPHTLEWTPELRAALAALAAHGTPAEPEVSGDE